MALGLICGDEDHMTDTPPDRLSPPIRIARTTMTKRCSSAASACVSKVRRKTNVEEYCVSEGWVRLAVGNTLDRKGKQLTIKYTGDVVRISRTSRRAKPSWTAGVSPAAVANSSTFSQGQAHRRQDAAVQVLALHASPCPPALVGVRR